MAYDDLDELTVVLERLDEHVRRLSVAVEGLERLVRAETLDLAAGLGRLDDRLHELTRTARRGW